MAVAYSVKAYITAGKHLKVQALWNPANVAKKIDLDSIVLQADLANILFRIFLYFLL
jgi:hypothetical protein